MGQKMLEHGLILPVAGSESALFSDSGSYQFWVIETDNLDGSHC